MEINKVLASFKSVSSAVGQVQGNIKFPTSTIDASSIDRYLFFRPWRVVKAGDALSPNNQALTDLLQLKDNVEQNRKTVFTQISKNVKQQAEQLQRHLTEKHTATIGSIALPIPPNIMEQTAYDFGADSLGLDGLVVSNVAKGIAAGGWGEAWESLKSQFPNILVGSLASIGVKGAERLKIDASGAIKTLLGVPNPFLKLNFNGVTFRNYQFQFHLAARNKEDADEIVKILAAFRYFSAPTGRDFAIFDVKYAWDIGFSPKIEKYLFRFKPCYLIDMQVIYNSMGASAFHSNGAPIDVNLILTFKEMVVDSQETYNDMYGENSSNAYLTAQGLGEFGAAVINANPADIPQD